MCAYRRKGSPYWQCRRRRLPGYGDTGQLNSQVRDRRTAERMEHLLEQIAQRALVQPAWYTLLDAVRDKQLPLLNCSKPTRSIAWRPSYAALTIRCWVMPSKISSRLSSPDDRFAMA